MSWPNALIFLGILAVVAIVTAISRRQRSDEMLKLARSLGMRFNPDPWNFQELEYFYPLGRGSDRKSSNLIYGEWRSIRWRIFYYSYTTGADDDETTHEACVINATLPLSLSPMRIRPVRMLDHVSAALGFDDLKFESEEFNQRYHVSSDSRQQAYDVIDPQMIEYLLSVPEVDLQFAGNQFVVAYDTGIIEMTPERIQGAMELMAGVIERIPGYLERDQNR